MNRAEAVTIGNAESATLKSRRSVLLESDFCSDGFAGNFAQQPLAQQAPFLPHLHSDGEVWVTTSVDG